MMTTLPKNKISEYLKQGELYRTLIENNDDPNEEVTFPANVLKLDTTVSSVEDCDNLFNTVRFWGLNNFVSKELIAFAMFYGNSEPIVEVLQKYEGEFQFVSWLRTIVTADDSEKGCIAIQSGVIELVLSLAEAGFAFPTDACEIAAEVGNLDVMKYLVLFGCKWNEHAARAAARHGHVNIMIYLVENGYNISYFDVCEAVLGGHVECVHYCLQYSVQDLPPLTSCYLCNEAARYGRLLMLQYLHEVGYSWDIGTTHAAAENGHFHCLQYLHEHGCPMAGPYLCQIAAHGGHLNCLQYAHEHGCIIDIDTAKAAVESGHLDCLQYAHEHGVTWSVVSSTDESYSVAYHPFTSHFFAQRVQRHTPCGEYMYAHATNTSML